MKKRKNRGQISNEFIILNAVLIIVLLMTLYMLSDNFSNIAYYKESKAMKDLGFSIQNEFLITQSINDGYHRTFIIPPRQDGFNFTIQNLDTTLVIISGKKNIEQHFLIPNVTGNIIIGANNISKIGGVVYLNQ